jgi:hypothetical protein
MHPNRSRLALAPCVLLALLPLGAGCTKEPAESTAAATAVATAPAAAQPAPAVASEPASSPASTASTATPAVPQSTAMAKGHIVLSGDYQADSEAEVTCATADTALQLTLRAPGKPRVLILLDDLAVKGTSGTYKGQVTLLVTGEGESGFRQSGGKASAEVTVDDVANGKAVSGSFATTYTGEGGKGKVQGRFDRCVFKPEPADRP